MIETIALILGYITFFILMFTIIGVCFYWLVNELWFTVAAFRVGMAEWIMSKKVKEHHRQEVCTMYMRNGDVWVKQKK